MIDKIYLVTGAAGLLGNNVVQELLKQGATVRAFVLENDPAVKGIPSEAEIVYGDLTKLQSLEKLFEVPQDKKVVVIHCASIVAVSPEPSQLVYDVNVDGTKNIVDLCVEKNVEKLVYISSTGAILEKPNNEQIVEPTEFFPEELVGYYSKTKAMATQYVLDAVENHGLNASIVYPSGICGPNDYAYGPAINFVIKYSKGEMPVGIEGSFNSVDVRDLAKGVVACSEKGGKGEGYIMSNEMVSMRRMFDLISEYSGAKNVETILTADQMIAMAGGASNDSAALEKLKFEIYNLIRNNNFYSNKAEKQLDYQTRPFEETMEDTIVWLKSEGKI